MFGRKDKQLSTCPRCGLAYDGRFVEERYRNLCPEHRREPMERDAKKAEVTRWAERNWEKLYEQAKTENAAFMQDCAIANANVNLQMGMASGFTNPYAGNLQAQMGGSGSPWASVFGNF